MLRTSWKAPFVACDLSIHGFRMSDTDWTDTIMVITYEEVLYQAGCVGETVSVHAVTGLICINLSRSEKPDPSHLSHRKRLDTGEQKIS